MKGEIIAAGGHWSEWQRYALAQVEAQRPHIGLLPTASGDSGREIDLFHQEQKELSSQPSHFSLFSDFSKSDPASWVEEQDIIVLPGGREEVAKAAWAQEGIVEILKRFYLGGGVILASEEGAGLLFSLSLDRHNNPFRGFAFLPGSFCLNYTNHATTYRDLIARGLLPPGWGLSLGTAVHFRDDKFFRALAFNSLSEVCYIKASGDEEMQDITFLY